eukprot:g11775.t1
MLFPNQGPHSDVNDSTHTAFDFIQRSKSAAERAYDGITCSTRGVRVLSQTNVARERVPTNMVVARTAAPLPDLTAKLIDSYEELLRVPLDSLDRGALNKVGYSSSWQFNEKKREAHEKRIKAMIEEAYEIPTRHKKWSPTIVRNTFSRIEYENGDVYEGEFREGFREGNGTYYFAKVPGTRYEGQFVRDEFHGYGVYFYERNRYEGDWVSSYKHGKGKYTNVEQNTEYSGDWCEGFRHGSGTLTSPEFLYEGEFHSDHMHGKGKITYTATGDCYEGDFCENLRHGRGKFVAQKPAEVYDGEWHEDLKQGSATQQLAGVGVYTGEFFQNKRHGAGEIVYDQETGAFEYFKGTWADDMKCEGKLKPRAGPLEDVLYQKNVQIRREPAE